VLHSRPVAPNRNSCEGRTDQTRYGRKVSLHRRRCDARGSGTLRGEAIPHRSHGPPYSRGRWANDHAESRCTRPASRAQASQAYEIGGL